MADPSGLAARHVLLVDDEADFLAELKYYLGRRGWVVSTSDTPAGALARLEAHPDIAVMVTDVRLADLDGFALASQVQRTYTGCKAVAVMVVTGHGELAGRGCADTSVDLPILPKPLAMRPFVKLLEAALDRALTARAAGQAPGAPPLQQGFA